MQKNKQVPMDVINYNATGIDIESRTHFVAIGQNKEDVKEFGVYNEDSIAMYKFLKENNIQTIAMDSTEPIGYSLYA
jgi:transposase